MPQTPDWAQEAPPDNNAVSSALLGQESGNNPNAPTSIDGAVGRAQIEPGTFAQYARPGEKIDNPNDNLAVHKRIVDDLSQKSGGDPARIAVGYFSGPSNIAPPDSPTPWKKDHTDGNGKSVSSYVSDVMGRINPVSSAQAAESVPDWAQDNTPDWAKEEPKAAAVPDWAQEQKPSVASDVGKSLVTGAVKGGANAAATIAANTNPVSGIPYDIAMGIKYLVPATETGAKYLAKDYMGGKQFNDYADQFVKDHPTLAKYDPATLANMIPAPSELVAKAAAAIGMPLHEPQTAPGRIAEGIPEFAGLRGAEALKAAIPAAGFIAAPEATKALGGGEQAQFWSELVGALLGAGVMPKGAKSEVKTEIPQIEATTPANVLPPEPPTPPPAAPAAQQHTVQFDPTEEQYNVVAPTGDVAAQGYLNPKDAQDVADRLNSAPQAIEPLPAPPPENAEPAQTVAPEDVARHAEHMTSNIADTMKKYGLPSELAPEVAKAQAKSVLEGIQNSPKLPPRDVWGAVATPEESAGAEAEAKAQEASNKKAQASINRSVAAKNKKMGAPTNILQSIAAAGGMKDEGNILKSQDMRNVMTNRGPLYTINGMSYDQAPQRAVDHGWIEGGEDSNNPSQLVHQHLFDALEAQHKGLFKTDTPEAMAQRYGTEPDETPAAHQTELTAKEFSPDNELEREFMQEHYPDEDDLPTYDREEPNDRGTPNAVAPEASKAVPNQERQEGTGESAPEGHEVLPSGEGGTGRAEEPKLPKDLSGAKPREFAKEGTQTVIPGAERIGDREFAERKMQGASQAKVAQKPADEGLFDVAGRGQGDLLGQSDAAKAQGEFQSDRPTFDHFTEGKTGEKQHKAVRDYVVGRGKDTGNEHIVVYDTKSGKITDVGTSGEKGAVSFSPEMTAAFANPKNSIDLHHNHPEELPLSAPDLIALTYRGVNSVTAHTHGEEFSSARLTPAAKDAFSNLGSSLKSVIDRAKASVSAFLDRSVHDGILTKAHADSVVDDLTNRALHKAGIIDYKSSFSHGAKELKDGDRLVSDAIDRGATSAKIAAEPFGMKEIRRDTKANNDAGRAETAVAHTAPEEGMAELYRRTSGTQKEPGSTRGISSNNDARPGVGERADGENKGTPQALKQRSEESKDEKGIARTIRDAISPTMASDAAKRFAGNLRQFYGEAERNAAKANATLEKFARNANKMTPEDQADFYRHVEGVSKGVELKNKTLQPLADALRGVMKSMRDQISAMPEYAKMGFVEDYMRHNWQQGEALDNFLKQYYAQQGSGAALKKRSIPTIEEGLAAGLKLEEPNPVRATAKYVNSMQQYLASVKTLRDLKDNHEAAYYSPSKAPHGWTPLAGNNLERIQEAKIDPVSNALIPAQNMKLYAPDDVATIYNRFMSKGFEDTKFKSVYGGMRAAVNSNTMMELGLSAYHASTMSIQSFNQDLSRIAKNISVGDWTGVGKAIKGFVTPRLIEGDKLAKQYFGEKNFDPQTEEMAKQYAAANLRLHNDPLSTVGRGSIYTMAKRGELGQEISRLKDQATKGYGVGLLKSGAEVLGDVVKTVSDPLFNHYIPRIKISAFADLMGDWIRQNPTASTEQITAARIHIGDMVEDRFGEMNQNNIFWNRMAKQVLALSFRAPGWDLGLIRQAAGPALDVYRMLNDARQGKSFNPANLDRALFMASAAVLYAATNSAMTWLHTGAPPSQQDVKDFMNFRTGGHTFTFGKWENERGVLPGHAKELLQLAPYPGEGPISGLTSEIGSKIASFPKNIYEVAHSVVTDKPPGFMKDKDWKKLTPAQRLAKQAEFIPQGYEPYAMQGVVNPPQGTELSPEERIVGIRPAGSRVIDPTDLANFMQKKR